MPASLGHYLWVPSEKIQRWSKGVMGVHGDNEASGGLSPVRTRHDCHKVWVSWASISGAMGLREVSCQCTASTLTVFREDGTARRTLREAALVWGEARGLRWVHLLILIPVWICFQSFVIIYFLNKLHCTCECMCACVCILLGIKLRTLLILGKHSTVVACDQRRPALVFCASINMCECWWGNRRALG